VAFSGLSLDQRWGARVGIGYAVAAAVAVAANLVRRRSSRGGRMLLAASVGAGALGALILPVLWLMTSAPATSDVTVVSRSGALLLHHGSPYLPFTALAHGGWLAYDPYLPVMAIFGLPGAIGVPGDTRPFLIVVTFALLYATFRAMRVRWPLGWAALAVSCPVMVYPLAMGITDPPIIALTCLALALVGRRERLWPAAVAVGVACAMKYTAWPALAVIAATVVSRDGWRAGLRFAGLATGVAAALIPAFAPAAIRHPAAIIANTLAYPLGLTAAKSPAQSPLPGYLLTTLGSGGHLAAIALLALSGLVTAVSLVVVPPPTPASAAVRIAIGLTALFALSPATRWGYLVYPLALCAWVAVERCQRSEGWSFRARGTWGLGPRRREPEGGSPPDALAELRRD
jgi:phosphatidylinositol alpha-1,6-mannosyltransferase